MDELTHDLMKLPIRLPSGHAIDKTSLDKYLNQQKLTNENSFYSGVDPFTQIQFSAMYKPIIDDRLKAKIDQFLLNNKISNNEIVNKKRKYVDEQLLTSPIIQDANVLVSLTKENFKKQIKLDNDSASCMCCLNKTRLNLYKIISCQHMFCKDCVINIKNFCIICKGSFKSSDVVNLMLSKD